MSDVYARIISFDFCSATLAYDINRSGFVEVEILNSSRVIKSVEAVGVGRLYLDDLQPASDIELVFRYPGGEKKLNFTTLPEPSATGSLRSRQAGRSIRRIFIWQ